MRTAAKIEGAARVTLGLGLLLLLGGCASGATGRDAEQDSTRGTSAGLTIRVRPGSAALDVANALNEREPVVSTLADALELARTRRAKLDARSDGSNVSPTSDTLPPIDILLAPGLHVERRGLVLDARDSNLRIRGEPGARLVGGIVAQPAPWTALTRDHRDFADLAARVPESSRAHVFVWPLPPELLAGWQGGPSGPVHSGHGVIVAAVQSELFIAGRPHHLARFPNDGFARIATLVDAGSIPRQAADDVPLAERVVEPPRGGVFTLDEPDRLARWAREPDLWAEGYWCWDWADEQLRVAAVDPAARTIALGAPHTYGLTEHARFFVVGALSELDAPGEYWLDRERGVVVAWLEPGDAEAECALSLTAEPLIAIEGASDVAIDGLVFETTRGPALTLRGVARLSVTRSTFRSIGTHAISLDGSDSSVTQCLFEDVGGTGVELAGGERATLEPARNVLSDCTFRRTGRNLRTYNPAIRLSGVGQSVSHVEVSDLPHIALFFSGNDHTIEASLFHHVVQETGDAGALYVGRDWTSQGTVIRDNVFHSIAGSDARYQNAVYLDDMASGITVEHNLFVDCNWGLLVGGGRDDVVRANTFVRCRKALFFDARGVGWMAKALADPASSTLHRLYASAPVESELWRARYPHLPEYLTDRFGRPAHGLVEANVLAATPLGEIHDRECVTERGTTSLEFGADALERAVPRWLADVRTHSITVGSAEFGPVGPRTATGARER